jgi:hypothetical protein
MERVWYLPHSPWMVPYAAGYYAHLHGLPEDREWVESNSEKLISLGTGRATLAEFGDERADVTNG